MKIQNADLAAAIRKGLMIKHILEDPLIYGAGIVEGDLRANVVGLALIGKSDVHEATRLFEEAVGEIGEEGGPATRRINELLGVKDFVLTESLIVSNQQTSALEISEQLGAGTYEVLE